MPWGSLILALLKLVDFVLTYARERQLLQAGQDKEIAKHAIAVLQKTEEAKKINEYLSSVRGTDLDDLLTDLEQQQSDRQLLLSLPKDPHGKR